MTTHSAGSLTPAEEMLWRAVRAQPQLAAFNVVDAMELTGTLQTDVLRKSLNTVVARRDVLRATYGEKAGTPYRRASLPHIADLREVDLSTIPETARDEAARGIALQEVERPFDLEQGPLYRVTLLRMAETRYLLLLGLHHMIADGYSCQILFQDIAQSYADLMAGRDGRRMPPQYTDYAERLQSWLSAARVDRALEYWRSVLAGCPPVPPLFTPAAADNQTGTPRLAHHVRLALSEDERAGIRAFSAREGLTPFMTLLAAFKVLYRRVTGASDIVTGLGVANRMLPQFHDVVGYCAHAVPLRLRVPPGSLRDVVREMRIAALGCFAHQYVPLNWIADAIPADRDRMSGAMLRAHFAMLPRFRCGDETLAWEHWPCRRRHVRIDLIVHVRGTGPTYNLEFVCKDGVVTEEQGRAFASMYRDLLSELVARPDLPVA